MDKHNVKDIREAFASLTERANQALGPFNDASVGIGRYVAGSSPWEKHNNGDELLLVTDGDVSVEVLGADDGSGDAVTVQLQEGALFVVPRGKWHQLTATDYVNILYISPDEAGVERQREHPLFG